MNTVCSIFVVAIVASVFFLKEYPTLFGIFVPTGAIRRNGFKLIVAVVMMGAIFLTAPSVARGAVADAYRSIDNEAVVIVTIAALVTLALLERFSISGSICYAVLGALEGYRLFAVEGAKFNYAMAGSWVAAVVVSLLFGALLYLIYKLLLGRAHIHFIRLSYYMRFAVLLGVALTAYAVGVNCGGLLNALNVVAVGELTVASRFIPVAVVAVASFVLRDVMHRSSDAAADRYFDYTVQTAVAVGFAVAFTLLLFSSERFCSSVGLQASPLSVTTLVFAALAGVGAVQRREMIERETVFRSLFGLVLTPLAAMLITCAIMFTFVTDRASNNVFDFSIIAVALLLLASVVFLNYVRNQQRQKEATAKIVYSQQQQLYENQRALNDMELKAILSENHGLHQTLEMKRKEIVNVALSISEQKEFLESLNALVKELTKTDSAAHRERIINAIDQSLAQRLSFDQEIDTFYTQAEMLHQDFSVKLSEEFPNLTLQERRLATLLRLGFSSKYIATLMNITPKSVEINRYRLRQKLGLSKGENLINFIKTI